MKKFLYEKSSTRKVTSKFNWGNPVKHFQNPQKPNRKELRGFQDLEAKKFKLTSGKLTSNRKKYSFNFFFWKKCGQIGSNSGQTVVKQWSN